LGGGFGEPQPEGPLKMGSRRGDTKRTVHTRNSHANHGTHDINENKTLE
jgi:hypothetical protein